MVIDSDRTFFGLDLSTQQLKGAVVDDSLHPIYEASVLFDSDLPEFRTHGGVCVDKTNPRVVTAPTIMWVKALDMLMDRLTVAGVDFSRIAAISGAAQQHGSVFWQEGAEDVLVSLLSDKFLHQQLVNKVFSLQNSPTWMDSSTSEQCKHLESIVGGPQELAKITGSRAYERFTGSQILKIFQEKPDVYKNTIRISLVSSFLCSLFLGRIAPIDISDASGMNLMNIHSRQWHGPLLQAAGPNLIEKLGVPVPSYTNLGNISPYFVERYGFNRNCRVIAFTGDNPSSLIGMRIMDNWIAVSLGTSDTVFLWLKQPRIVLNGHILCNPVNSNHYMAMLCFKNGSLIREKIRNSCAEGSWEIFNQLLNNTPRGNFGNMGLYYTFHEILPPLNGEYRFNKGGDRVIKFTSLEVEVRALIEGQFIAKRAYSEDIGLEINENTKILATGGASKNKSILQVLADVFNAPVYVQKTENSAVSGAAYQAKYGLLANTHTYEEITSCLQKAQKICEPFADANDIYIPMVKRFKKIVAELTDI